MKINILKFLGFFSLIFCSNFVFAAGGQEGEAERQPRGLRLFVPAQPQDQVRVVRDLLGEQTAEITGDFRAYAVELNGSLAVFDVN